MRLLDSISIVNFRQGISPCKLEHTKSFNSSGLKPYVHLITPTIPVIEFSIEFQSNQLIYDKGYSIRQQVIYSLIILLRQEGLGYRRISRKLNQWGIKTHRNKQWFNSSAISVLKRKHERDLMNDQIRNQYFPSKVSKFEVNYYIIYC